MKKIHKSPLAATLGATLLSGLAMNAHADSVLNGENPFAMRELSGGYMLTAEADAAKQEPGKTDNNDSKMKDGACGEGKCGGAMLQQHGNEAGGKKMPEADAKAMEGKCAGMKK